MKKILLILVALCAACTMQAQDRTIKMPTEKGKTSFNPAEQEKGYWCALEVGGGATTMEGRKNLPMGEIIFSNGYRINQYLKVGVGIGALYYIANNNEVRGTTRKLSMPLFATLRGNFLNEDTRSVVPYWTANVGASLPDGLFFTPGVGLRVGEMRNAFIINLNYTLRELKMPADQHKYYSGIMLKLGYEF